MLLETEYEMVCQWLIAVSTVFLFPSFLPNFNLNKNPNVLVHLLL